MRAIVVNKDGVAVRSDYPGPRPAQGESIVRVSLAGICGTDLELARGYMNYRGVPGHEFVGHVVESAESLLIGRRVVGEINAACGRCRACARELGRHCPNRTVLGILGRDGAMAEYLTLPNRNLFVVPDSVPDEGAVFVEPLAAAYEIFEQRPIARDSRVLVLGDGRLGSLVATVFRSEDYDVRIAGHHSEKLSCLAKLGFATTDEREMDALYDVVVDCTGSAAGFQRAVELVRPRGLLILKSTAADGANLNLAPVVISEITVLGSRCGRFEPALGALAARKIDPTPLISAIYPLDDATRAFEAAAAPSNFKVLLRPT